MKSIHNPHNPRITIIIPKVPGQHEGEQIKTESLIKDTNQLIVHAAVTPILLVVILYIAYTTFTTIHIQPSPESVCTTVAVWNFPIIFMKWTTRN